MNEQDDTSPINVGKTFRENIYAPQEQTSNTKHKLVEKTNKIRLAAAKKTIAQLEGDTN